MSNKSFSKLSSVLSEVLSKTLEENDVENVMKLWNEKKSEVVRATTQRQKKRKDSNAPKKWKTGYILFCVAQREKVKKSNPNISAKEITRKMGELWKGLSDKEKAKYDVESKKDRVRYDEEMKGYTPPSDVEDDEPTKKKRAKKEKTGPKKPLSGFMFFCQATRPVIKEDMPKLTGKDITIELGKRWKELTDDEKVPFNKQHAEDKVRYEREKEEAGLPPSKPSKASKAKEKVENDSDSDSKVKKGKKEVKKEEKKPEVKADAKKGKDSKAKEVKKEEKKPEPKKGKTKEPEVKADAKKGKVEAKPVSKVAKKTVGCQKFLEEEKENVEAEHPDWNEKKLLAETEKRWSGLSDEERKQYDEEAEAEDDSDEDLD